MAMACTILSIPSKIWTDRGSVVKYWISTKVAPISCTSSGDKYLSPYFNPDEDVCMKQTKKLKEFKRLIMKSKGDQFSFKTLECINAVQRLGIDHHFQQEMEMWRHEHMTNLDSVNQSSKHDLYQLSLSFRLIREQGHHVSADIFLRFKNEEGNIEIIKEHRKDVRALMALYEASQLSIKGETILDEAANLSSNLLNQMLTKVDKKTAAIIDNTLKHPYHKSLTILNADNLFLEFEGLKTWEKSLKELSHLEFLIAQEKHRQELHQVSKWWKNVGLVEELTHARDQILLWYTFPMGMLPDLSLSDERIDLTKCIALIYYIDDIFDLYGKQDELALFTQVVNRWDLSAADQLPDYMNKCFHILYDTTNEIGNKIIQKHGSYNALWYLQKSWARIFNSFLVEARWFDSHELPKSDEYLNNGSISIGVELLLVHAFFLLGLGHVSTDLDRVSGIISSVSTIFRLWDDMGGAKEDEDETGYDGSYIACYMNEHKGISVEVAREHAFQVIGEEWKQLNEECLGLSQYFASFKTASLNVARMGPVMYDSDNKQRLPALDKYINSMLYSDLQTENQTPRIKSRALQS